MLLYVCIIPASARLMKELYGIDMEEKQYSKTYDKIPTPDIAMKYLKM